MLPKLFDVPLMGGMDSDTETAVCLSEFDME